MPASGHGSKRHARPLAIAALLVSPSIAQAAEKAGIDEKTLDRWLKEQAFQRQYRAARRQAVEQSLAVLQGAMIHATGTLLNLLKSDQPAVQCRAALGIIHHGVGALSLLDLETRVAALEEATGAKERP